MNKRHTFKNQPLGFEPGSVVYVGDKALEIPVKLTLIEYSEEKVEEKSLDSIHACDHTNDMNTVKWLNVDGVHNSKLIEQIGEKFNIHPLFLEGIANTEQRPKMDEHDNLLFTLVKMLSYNEVEKKVEVEQVSIILGSNFLISFQEDKEGDIFEPLRNKIRAGKQKIRKSGPDYLFFCLLDTIIDHYFVILEKLGEHMDELEEKIISSSDYNMVRTIYRLKREVLFLRKNIWPMREMLGGLERSDTTLISESTHIYFRDIYDHSIQAIETIESYRDMLSGMLDIFLSSTGNHMNNIMKVLTIISTIFIPLTFIVGVYGMNFDYMPELHWKYGYLFVWIIMAATILSMFMWFKKKRWF